MVAITFQLNKKVAITFPFHAMVPITFIFVVIGYTKVGRQIGAICFLMY
jgi:hypothetical protein